MDDFTIEASEVYFKNALQKSVAPPKGNVPRIKQKIGESEDESKAPGAKYLKDILRATAYYFKYDMLKCLDDLKLFVEAKKG